MSLNIHNFSRLSARGLKEIDTNRISRESDYRYGYYKLDKPKNGVCVKSIYTQDDESQFYGVMGYQENDIDGEDLEEFIQNSKTLRDRIQQKLDKKKAQKTQRTHRNQIVEATFRPNLQTNFKENQAIHLNQLTNRKSIQNRFCVKKNQSQRRRIKTEIEEANDLWDQKQKTIADLSFHERQQKTLQNKKAYVRKVQELKQQKELEGCTFKPKLTKYVPKKLQV